MEMWTWVVLQNQSGLVKMVVELWLVEIALASGFHCKLWTRCLIVVRQHFVIFTLRVTLPLQTYINVSGIMDWFASIFILKRNWVWTNKFGFLEIKNQNNQLSFGSVFFSISVFCFGLFFRFLFWFYFLSNNKTHHVHFFVWMLHSIIIRSSGHCLALKKSHVFMSKMEECTSLRCCLNVGE